MSDGECSKWTERPMQCLVVRIMQMQMHILKESRSVLAGIECQHVWIVLENISTEVF
jgi:hypothetical protein